MSRTTEYTLDLVVNGDKVRNTIKDIDTDLKGLGDKAKKAAGASGVNDSLKNAQAVVDKLKAQMSQVSKSLGGEFDSIIKSYARSSEKAIGHLEAQYARLEAERKSKESEYQRLQKELEQNKTEANNSESAWENSVSSFFKVCDIQERIKDLGYEQLEAQIQQNRQIRKNLADIQRKSVLEHNEVKDIQAAKEAEAERTKEREKLKELEEAYKKAKDNRDAQKNDASDEINKLKDELSNAKKNSKTDEIERLKTAIAEAKARQVEQDNNNKKEIEDLKEKIKFQRASVKLEEAQEKLSKAQDAAKSKEKYDKLEELKAKRKIARGAAEKTILKQEIALQKAYIKQVEAAEKTQIRNGEAVKKAVSFTETMLKSWNKTLSVIGKVGSATKKVAKGFASATQVAYNVTGMVGGAARTAAGAGKAAAGMVSGAISSMTSSAEREVERERAATRVKGFSLGAAKSLISDIYIQTGADDESIVDAINSVMSVIKSNDRDEFMAAAITELRYPGSAKIFASSNANSDSNGFTIYGNKMKAAQNATGATNEQIQAAQDVINNLKKSAFKNASKSDLQGIYLGLQNSGAFDSQEKLDQAFKKFVSDQSKSKQNAFEFAKNYDWGKAVSGGLDRLSVFNTIGQVRWDDMRASMDEAKNQHSPAMTSAETMMLKMRQLEEKKNELVLKLIPAVLPVVEKLSALISGPTGQKIIDGIVNLFESVIPMLDPIFSLLKPVLEIVGKVMNFLSTEVFPRINSVVQIVVGGSNTDDSAMPQKASGGVALMPSIVGERGPEAIIPLDYSRAQRAENIANTVNQTFNMGGSQTTALSLAQAVRSRDFTRAMTDNQFFTRRCGAF